MKRAPFAVIPDSIGDPVFMDSRFHGNDNRVYTEIQSQGRMS